MKHDDIIKEAVHVGAELVRAVEWIFEHHGSIDIEGYELTVTVFAGGKGRVYSNGTNVSPATKVVLAWKRLSEESSDETRHA